MQGLPQDLQAATGGLSDPSGLSAPANLTTSSVVPPISQPLLQGPEFFSQFFSSTNTELFPLDLNRFFAIDEEHMYHSFITT